MTDSTQLFPPFAEEILPGGGHRSFVLKRGQLLRLTDLRGGANVSLTLLNANEKTERLNLPDSLKCQHTAKLTTGHCLYSDMGRVLAAKVSEEIAPGDYETLLKGIQANPGQFNRKILLLDTIGGSAPEAMRMGRLAVSASEHGKGYGPLLLGHAVNLALSVRQTMGVRVLVVDAKDAKAAAFYAAYGFRHTATRALSLYLPIAST